MIISCFHVYLFFFLPPFLLFFGDVTICLPQFCAMCGCKGQRSTEEKKYHTNAFCLKMRMMKAFAFFQEVRPKSGKRHGSMTQHSMLCKCMATCRYAPRMGWRCGGGSVCMRHPCTHVQCCATAFAHMFVYIPWLRTHVRCYAATRMEQYV